MKCLRVLYLLAILIMSVFVVALSDEENHGLLFDDEDVDDVMQGEDREIGSLRGVGRFLVQKAYNTHQANNYYMTCNKYPRVCRAKGSQGPDCCKKKCVNTMTDKVNCGMCGKKCKYPEICCKGKCVNPLNDRNNCGGCKKKCSKGFKCGYGMCNYA